MKMVGQGVYSMSDVAALSGLPVAKLRRWFTSGKLLTPEHGTFEQKPLLSFLDLVEALVIGQFREHGVSLQAIRRCHERVGRLLKTSHPFANQQLQSSGGKLYLSELDGERLVDVEKMQLVFPQVIARYLKKLDYDPSTHIATRWHIAKGIVVDPEIGFGAPTIEGTGIKAAVLDQAWRSNGRDVALVARWFEVTPEQVQAAVDFAEHRWQRAA